MKKESQIEAGVPDFVDTEGPQAPINRKPTDPWEGCPKEFPKDIKHDTFRYPEDE